MKVEQYNILLPRGGCFYKWVEKAQRCPFVSWTCAAPRVPPVPVLCGWRCSAHRIKMETHKRCSFRQRNLYIIRRFPRISPTKTNLQLDQLGVISTSTYSILGNVLLFYYETLMHSPRTTRAKKITLINVNPPCIGTFLRPISFLPPPFRQRPAWLLWRALPSIFLQLLCSLTLQEAHNML